MLQASEIAPMCSAVPWPFVIASRLASASNCVVVDLVLRQERHRIDVSFQHAQTACRVNGAMLPVAFAEFLGAACGGPFITISRATTSASRSCSRLAP